MSPTPASTQTLYSIYWHDDEETINVLAVHRRWSWDEAHELIGLQNEAVSIKEHPTYTIVWFQRDANLVPHGGQVLHHLRKLVETDPGKEEMCIFIGDVFVIQTLVSIVSAVLPQLQVTSHYRFAASLDAALKLIATHKQVQDAQ